MKLDETVLNLMTDVLIRRGKDSGRRPPCEAGAETGVMWSQSKECVELPEAGKGRKDPPLESSEGEWPCPHLGFRLPAFRP